MQGLKSLKAIAMDNCGIGINRSDLTKTQMGLEWTGNGHHQYKLAAYCILALLHRGKVSFGPNFHLTWHLPSRADMHFFIYHYIHTHISHDLDVTM